MPVYDYRCSECGQTYDVFHKGREVVEDVVCPSCGSVCYKKMMSVPLVSMVKSSPHAGSSCETGGCCGGTCGLN